MKKNINVIFAIAAVIISILGIGMRLAGLDFISMDMRAFVMRWYDQLARQGFSAMRTDFSNYTPPYLYLLWIAAWTRSFLPEVAAIKMISILFDIGNAVLVYKILRVKYPEGSIPFLGAAAFFSLPTVILDSAWWGQADAIYAFFTLACLYFLLRDQPLPSMIFFGIAASFKLQAVFIAPFLFLLALKRRIPFAYFFVVPVMYVLMMIPAIMMGRPVLDTLTIYLSQADAYRQLTLKAPNLYQFIPGNFNETILMIGLGMSALAALIWVIVYAIKVKTWTPEILLMCAAVSAIMMPFLLPKMHERYFYVADALILILAFYLPRIWTTALASQMVSVITYSIYLFSHSRPDSPPATAESVLLIIAAMVNTLLVGYLFWKQYAIVEESHLLHGD